MYLSTKTDKRAQFLLLEFRSACVQPANAFLPSKAPIGVTVKRSRLELSIFKELFSVDLRF